MVRRDQDSERELVELCWGLIPVWAKPDSKLPLMINARAETVASKPSYCSAFKSRRCIVPAILKLQLLRVTIRRRAFLPQNLSRSQPIQRC